MARSVSILESHPQRQKIINALVAGSTLAQIVAWAVPKVTESAICRWRQKISRESASTIQSAQDILSTKDSPSDELLGGIATRVAMAVAVDPFLLAVQELRQDRARIKGKAEDTGDLRTWVAADRNDLTSLELHAKLAGRLDAGPSHTNIMIVCPAAPEFRSVPSETGVTIDIDPRPNR